MHEFRRAGKTIYVNPICYDELTAMYHARVCTYATGKTWGAVRPHYAVRCPHGKEFFAVRGHKDARHPLTHGIDSEKRTAKKHAWQRARETHGKEKTHGKNTSRRTAKRRSTAKEALRCRGAHFAVRHGTKHGKGAFAVRRVLCRVQKMIFF
jgi:hypothetical protein